MRGSLKQRRAIAQSLFTIYDSRFTSPVEIFKRRANRKSYIVNPVTIITDEACTGYARPGHPERPQRIIATAERLKSQTELALAWVAPTSATDEQILRAHT